jgi:bifunctional UDP-N-acetylglucosamine pyrophosphorylase/glucosamine-1-phosphate N-acetyltransferase
MPDSVSEKTTTESLHALLEQRLAVCARLIDSGVAIVDPATAFIDAGVTIGAGSVIEPNTTVSGDSTIGRDCRIGPNSVLENARIGEGCTVFASVVRDSEMGDRSDIGPFGHLRGGTVIGADVHLGHSVEINRSRIGRGTKAAHFCYIADAEVGEKVNIGAGAVTCNYDGESKHSTVIGDGAFIGSDTMLVAPVVIGKGAVTAAGSVVREDVPDGGRVAGVPARPLAKQEQQ